MTGSHTSYEDLARQRRGSDEYRQGHAEAQRAFLIGKAVRERRLALGLSQARTRRPGRHDPARAVPPRSRRRHTHHPAPGPDLRRPRC